MKIVELYKKIKKIQDNLKQKLQKRKKKRKMKRKIKPKIKINNSFNYYFLNEILFYKKNKKIELIEEELL